MSAPTPHLHSVATEGDATATTGGVDARSHNGAKDGHDDSVPAEPSRTRAPGPDVADAIELAYRQGFTDGWKASARTIAEAIRVMPHGARP